MRTLALPLVALLLVSAAPAEPRPVAAWAAGPMEVRVAFDEPLGQAIPAGLAGGRIAFEADGEPASLGIAAARLEDGGRTLVLFTDPHPRAATYRLPPLGPGLGAIAYRPAGVEVSWAEGDADPLTEPAWTAWWPAFDPVAAREATAGLPGHAGQFDALSRPGRLALRTFFDAPAGPGTIRLEADAPFEATVDFEPIEPVEADGQYRAEAEVQGGGESIELSLSIVTGTDGRPLTFRAILQTGGAGEFAPLPSARLTPPWVPPALPTTPEASAPPFDLAGGDPKRGEEIFRGEEAKCATCHKFRGEGGDVGPDLSGLPGFDPAVVFRHIAEPSARIHPEYVTYSVATEDGRVLVGIVRAVGADRLRVADIGGAETVVDRGELVEFQPSATSTMPVGLAGAIGEQGMRDLIAYLLAKPD